jgi:hypothetical protein
MYGVQNIENDERKARAMKWLRRRGSDASSRKPGWQALSDFVASLIGGAVSRASRLVQVASMSQHQGYALCTSTCALTSGSSGSQTFRCAPSLLTTNPKR